MKQTAAPLTAALLIATAIAVTASCVPPANDWAPQAYETAANEPAESTAATNEPESKTPEDCISRAEMVSAVLSALGLDASSGQDLTSFMGNIDSFADVHDDDWFHDAFAVAYGLQLIDGTSATQMSPNDIATREMAIALLCRLMVLDTSATEPEVLDQFADCNALSPWAKPYVAAMVAEGYLSGTDGRLNPQSNITSQSFEQLLHELFQDNIIADSASADALAGSTVAGNLLITSGNATLTDLTVAGDVIIGDGVGNGTVILDNVAIGGRLVIRGGGSDSIVLQDTTISTAIVQKLSDGSVRIYGEDGSAIDYVEITDGKDAVIIECDVKNLTILADDILFVVNGEVHHMVIYGDGVVVSGSGSVDEIELGDGVSAITVETANTTVKNHSGGTVLVADEGGEETTVSDGKSILVNEGTVARRATDNGGDDDSSSSGGKVHRPYYDVTFHSNGGIEPSSLSVREGKPLGGLPVPAKPNSVFIGWFTDDGIFENEVYATTIVQSDLELYACYFESEPLAETDSRTETSAMDVATDFVITVLSSDTGMTAEDVRAAMTFETITEEASDFGGITVAGNNGTYTVAATDGYTPGCSYSLSLDNDALTFEDESDSIRTFNLTVAMAEPVLNVTLCGDVQFVPAEDVGEIDQQGQAADTLYAPLFSMGDEPSDETPSGSFTYLGELTLAVGDRLAIYEGTPLDERLPGENYSDETVSYVTITAVSEDGRTIEYVVADPDEILFVPDLIPVKPSDDMDGDPDNFSLTIDDDKLTFIDPEDFPDFSLDDFGLDATTTIDAGDYIVFYENGEDLEDADAVIFVKISDVERLGDWYVIGYEASSEAEYLSYMDISVTQELSYDELVESLDLEEVSAEVERDVLESGFAEAAAEYLVALAQADEEIQAQVCEELGIEDFSSAIAPSAEPLVASGTPDVDVTVRAQITKDLKHWTGSGLRCLVSVTCEVELGDHMKLQVTGTFVQEFKVERSLTAQKIRKGLKVVDRRVVASLDVYTYTYLSMDLGLYSKNASGWSDKLDIKKTINDLKGAVDKATEDTNDEVQEFYELYQKMMDVDHGYFPLFSVQLCKFEGGIDPFHIFAFAFTAEFVVSLNVDVALGTQFEYEKATRYYFVFSLTHKTAVYGTTDLIDEHYEFTVYAMGTLAVRVGLKLTLEVGLITTALDSIGVSAEAGAYWQVWGFLYYHLEYANKQTTTEYAGACYMELGLYVSIKFQAQALGKLVSYSKELWGDSWPLWSAGEQYYTYDFGYELTDANDDIILKAGAPSYSVPSAAYEMSRMDFTTGEVANVRCSAGQFEFLVKNDPDDIFTVENSGKIIVAPPDDSDLAEATLQVTWKSAPLVFTSAPISRTFTLVWDDLADSYVINFDTNGGNNIQGINGAYRTPISLPTPSRAGYVFNGWYTDNGTFQNAFTESRMPAANLTLYAKWTASSVSYTVRHYKQDVGSNDYTLADTDSLFGVAGSSVTPSRKNYQGFVTPAAQTVTLAGDGSTMVNYRYGRNSYSLTFKPANGSDDIVRTYEYGTEIVAPAFVRSGYTFDGWDTEVAATMPAHALTYTAQWSKNTYSIVCDLQGGSVSSANPQNYTVDSAAITLTNPTKQGFFFAGWTGTGLTAATTSVTIDTGSTGDRYYSATWKSADKTPYCVQHHREDLSGGYTILEIESRTGTTGQDTAAVARSYSGFTAGTVTQQEIAADGTTIVHINYSRNSYTLTFDDNGGQGGTSGNVKYGANISAPTVTRTGYALDGWDSAVAATMPASPTTYTAQWTANAYTITFDKNSDDATGTMSDQDFTYDEEQAIATNAFARTGYEFAGWNTDDEGDGTSYDDGETVSNLTAVDDGVVTLYAQWVSASGCGAFEAKYSAEYQVFDFIIGSSTINGNAYDSSWGSASWSGGHQFTDTMLADRYFTICKTGDDGSPFALYMYESDGTPVVSGTSGDLYASSLIGSESNVNLTQACKDSLLDLYGADWAEGLAATGDINDLWDEGFMFSSQNGFGYFVSGKQAHTVMGSITLTNHISNPTMTQLDAVSDYEAGPLTGA